jgi:hypothetical protein
MSLEHATEIILPQSQWQELLAHCNRKLAENYLPDETKYPRAYGLIAGSQQGNELHIESIMPVMRNVRSEEPFKTYMDKILTEHAVPSKTPLSERAWMTDPTELKRYYDICDRDNLIIIGTYHSHIVPWAHDPIRDTPTKLDTLLARNSNFYQFIISLVDIDRPIIRAFYEGYNDKETPVALRP